MAVSGAHLHLREEDVVRLVLEFLSGRKLHISQLSVERETGVINGLYSDDVLFLRQLILDGQWDDVLEFVQPLEGVASFDHARFRFIVLRQKYVELLCIKGEAGLSNLDTAVEEILKVLSDLEKCCPTKEVYNYLRLLLPLPKLIDHADYRDWNPSSARVRCFDEILPLVEKFLPFDKSGKDATQEAKNDRLLHLLIKGLLYESCVEFCQRRALAGPGKDGAALQLKFSALLNSPKKLHDTDLSLLSWLQSIPAQTFAHPFEQKTLEVDVERLQKPALETSWTEHMLITPIKPKIFPHSAMPVGRPRAVDVMSRSLNPAMENVPFGQGTMWRSSLASFHLTGKKSMTTSVDRLFENEEPSFNSQITTIAEVPDSTTTTETKNPPPVAAAVRPSGSEPVQGDLLREFQRSRQRAPAEEIPHYQTPANNPSIKLIPPSLPNTEMTSANFASDLPREKPQPSVQNGSGSGSLGSGTSGVPELGSRPPKTQDSSGKPRFVAVTSLEDVQAIRCAEFHPAGRLYAVGSNSKTLRICSYPKLSDLKDDHSTYQPTVLFKRTKHHKGSIYCMGWSPAGDLIATGSNDKTVKLMRFNADTCNIEGQEIELTMHDGTVRDICFIEDLSNRSSLLISGGAGDCKIYVTDCVTGTPFQAMSGHSGHILSLYTWGGAMFVSGSQDKTVRMWDLRTRGCVNMFTPITAPNSPVNKGSPVASVAVDPSGRLMVSGHEDSSCVLYDIRGNRTVQSFKPHTSDVRSVRFSPSAYYLLTAGYDNKIVLTDLQGDLTLPLPSIVVAQHQDKVISGRWHPTDFSFLSTSADKTSTLWALPPL